MKWMFVADIHGNITIFDEVIQIFKQEQADKLIILGDTASFDNEEDNQYMADILNELGNKVEIIRGNCDTYDFEQKLQLELYDFDQLFFDGIIVSITHGHRYHYEYFPCDIGDVFIQGHTHIPVLRKERQTIIANPGSITRPRGTDLRCYILMENQKIVLKTIEGKLVSELKIEMKKQNHDL